MKCLVHIGLLILLCAAAPDAAAAKTLVKTLDDAERLAHKVTTTTIVCTFIDFVHLLGLTSHPGAVPSPLGGNMLLPKLAEY